MIEPETANKPVVLWSQFVEGNIPKGYKDLSEIPGVLIDLRYASTNNFTGKNLYGAFKKAFLHEIAFEKLKKAQAHLVSHHPGYTLLILDALRPRNVQRILFSYVEGTPEEIYVANPDKGSVHNFGFAVDLTISDVQGNELDMGTPFDDFTELAQPRHEEKFLESGELTSPQMANRKMLYDAMTAGGYTGIPNEWWHFNALHIQEIKTKFPIVE